VKIDVEGFETEVLWECAAFWPAVPGSSSRFTAPDPDAKLANAQAVGELLGSAGYSTVFLRRVGHVGHLSDIAEIETFRLAQCGAFLFVSRRPSLDHPSGSGALSMLLARLQKVDSTWTVSSSFDAFTVVKNELLAQTLMI